MNVNKWTGSSKYKKKTSKMPYFPLCVVKSSGTVATDFRCKLLVLAARK